jgi:hypothetical protein
MSKTLCVSAALIVTAGCGQQLDYNMWHFDNSPGRVFDMKKNITNKTQVVVRYVKASEVEAACNEQSRKFGHNGFPNGALACTWFTPDRCVMILPEMVDMRTAGHEFLHCLQGNWHKE